MRRGVGKVRHLDTNRLWIQDQVSDGTIILNRVDWKVNPSDMLAKHVTHDTLMYHVRKLRLSFES